MPFAECIEHMYLKGLMGIREFMVLYPIKDETEKSWSTEMWHAAVFLSDTKPLPFASENFM